MKKRSLGKMNSWRRIGRTAGAAVLLMIALGMCVSCGHGEGGHVLNSLEAGDDTGTEVTEGRVPGWGSMGWEDAGQGNGARTAEDTMAENVAERKAEMEEVAVIWREASERAAGPDSEDCLEISRQIIGKLGEKGYAAIDCENQVDMAGAELVERFCETVGEGGAPEDGKTVEDGTEADTGEAGDVEADAELVVFVVDHPAGLTRYTLRDSQGRVGIEREFYQWENGELSYKGRADYMADHWKYTQEGWLFFGRVRHRAV